MLGLSSNEAQTKLSQYGPNELRDSNQVTPLRILIRQIRSNFVLYMLFGAVIISFIVGKFTTAYTVIGVIVTVIGTGFIQEYKAERSISDLKKMVLPTSYVIRDGKKRSISSSEIVPGDVLILSTGEKIPADGEIIESYELQVNEATLTGESKEISKSPIGQDQSVTDNNRVFMGTYVVNGRAFIKVTHTGMNTMFGKIAHLISTAEKELPLQAKVNQIAKYMVTIAIIISIVTGLIMIFRSPELNTSIIIEILIFIVALSVSAFPEGFPVVLMTTLAIGAKRMSKHNAIVNRMSIIETLGEVSTICSDKTGTITKGEMTVKHIFTSDQAYTVTGIGFDTNGQIIHNETPILIKEHTDLHQLILTSLICNDADLQRTEINDEYRVIGTPTEGALLILGAKLNIFKDGITSERKSEIPFSSQRKMMSIIVQQENDLMVYAKGAPEVLLSKCSHKFCDGKVVKLVESDRSNIANTQKVMAESGYRMLGLAYKKISQTTEENPEENLVFLGQVAMEDPPREETADSIKTAEKAGIRVMMITGDHKDTAFSIASQIGLVPKIIDGAQIDQSSDNELAVLLKENNVFARVKPEHKIRIVRALKSIGEIVAMTGDGVNDAPALKEAHVGIAMGKNGTDVSRSAADLILKDDNFTTIITAIAEGRTVFNNIRKFVTFQLSCNVAELMILLVGLLLAPYFGWQVPLMLSIQILLMNLVTDNMPAITLGLNPSSKDILLDKPRKENSILNPVLIRLLLFTAFLMMILTLSANYIASNIFNYSAEQSRTFAFVTLVVVEVVTAFSFRSFRKSTLNRSPLVNKYLFIATCLSMLVTLIVIYTPARILFETTVLNFTDWIVIGVLAITMVVLNDIIKYINNQNQTYLNATR